MLLKYNKYVYKYIGFIDLIVYYYRQENKFLFYDLNNQRECVFVIFFKGLILKEIVKMVNVMINYYEIKCYK